MPYKTSDRPAFHICVIGGGFTGAAAAIGCLQRIDGPFHLTVIEPAASLGRGVAYGAHHPLHLLNVRARDLSVFVDRPGDFVNWAFQNLDQGENDAGLLEGLGHAFLPRQLFGEYVRQRLFEVADRRHNVKFKVVTGSATSCSRSAGSFAINTDRAETIQADVVILGTAYGAFAESGDGALLPFGFIPPDRFAQARSMVLIGSGLTMVDVLLNARREGFAGKATIISRRGQLPREHAAKGVVPKEMALPNTKSLARLTASIRIACEAAEAYGTPWQAVINGLRPSISAIWQQLDVVEQSRFLRHVRPFWDTHRHRLPPEVYRQLRQEMDQGLSRLLRGRVLDIRRSRAGFAVDLRRHGATLVETLNADLAFDCRGHKPDLRSALIRSVVDQGLARADPHNLGLAVKPDGRVLGIHGVPTPGLYALGPLCQGSLWEIMAVPEIVRQADLAASHIHTLTLARSPVRVGHEQMVSNRHRAIGSAEGA